MLMLFAPRNVTSEGFGSSEASKKFSRLAIARLAILYGHLVNYAVTGPLLQTGDVVAVCSVDLFDSTISERELPHPVNTASHSGR